LQALIAKMGHCNGKVSTACGPLRIVDEGNDHDKIVKPYAAHSFGRNNGY